LIDNAASQRCNNLPFALIAPRQFDDDGRRSWVHYGLALGLDLDSTQGRI